MRPFDEKHQTVKQFISILFSILVSAACLNAQQNTFSFSSQPSVVSPEISGSEVTFRLAADYTTTVRLCGSWLDEPVPMRKSEGVWSVTVALPAPEIYTYYFLVDGVAVQDPANCRLVREGSRYYNLLMVNGAASANYFEAQRRGSVEYVWYNSRILGFSRRMAVYLPDGYYDKANAKKQYPVLFLLHGEGDDEESWISKGRASMILDNLILQGKASQMIVVMPNCNPGQQASATLGLSEVDASAKYASPDHAMARSICEEIVPFISSSYRVNAKPAFRVLSGQSSDKGVMREVRAGYPNVFGSVKNMPEADNVDEWAGKRVQLNTLAPGLFK